MDSFGTTGDRYERLGIPCSWAIPNPSRCIEACIEKRSKERETAVYTLYSAHSLSRYILEGRGNPGRPKPENRWRRAWRGYTLPWYAGDQSFRRACARRDGHAARRAAIAKRGRYPTADLVPFALETGGRLGTDARAFVIRMADAADDPFTELQYLYRAVSSVLQDGVARQLQRALD